MGFSGQVDRNVVVAINEENGNVYSDPNVRCTIDQHNRETYFSAANFLNTQDVDVVSLQHEYGIFGGEWGEYVLDLVRNIDMPIVSTFHTVLRRPPEKARQVLSELAQLSTNVVVMIESAARLLVDRFGVDSGKINVIRHGAAFPDRIDREYTKRRLELHLRTVLATFGLISSGKGIEYAIGSLRYLVKERPEILYLVIGETHPNVRRHEGEAYREKLISQAKQLGVERNVRFVDRYLGDDELSLYLQAVDVYLAPYLGKDQVSSGTLTLALGHGKAIVATPTTFAKEVLADNRGLFCKFADSRPLAECVERVLGNARLRRQLEANAFKFGQDLGWGKVADQYGDVFRSARRTAGIIGEAAPVRQA